MIDLNKSIDSVVRYYSCKYKTEYDDLSQVAQMGIIYAEKKFNPTKKLKKTTYTTSVVKGLLKNYIYNNKDICLNRSQLLQRNRFYKLYNESNNLKHVDRIEYIKTVTGVKKKTINKFLNYAHDVQVSVNIEDDVCSKTTYESAKNKIKEIVGDRNAKIFVNYHVDNYNIKQLSEKFKVSTQRISFIIINSKKLLKNNKDLEIILKGD